MGIRRHLRQCRLHTQEVDASSRSTWGSCAGRKSVQTSSLMAGLQKVFCLYKYQVAEDCEIGSFIILIIIFRTVLRC